MKPRWEKIEKENQWLETEYYDIDEQEDVAMKYTIDSYPTCIFLDKNGNEIERLIGEVSESKILKKIHEHREK